MSPCPRFPIAFCVAALLSFSGWALAQEPAFEIKDGDRIALLGDALLERENTYGYLETRLHQQFSDRTFSVRNLAWSGDTPAGWSRASFDGPEKGIERLKEHLALVKPTVVILGYGMAASLQEMTDKAQDPTLNPDPARYGAEPMSAPRFKKELGALMDLIEEDRKAETGDRKEAVRFVLLSPIKHEDLREALVSRDPLVPIRYAPGVIRPGLPDPSAHNLMLEQYVAVVEQLAKERAAAYVDLFHGVWWVAQAVRADGSQMGPNGTVDGIHLTDEAFGELPSYLAYKLGWTRPKVFKDEEGFSWKGDVNALHAAILRKNDLFFHRFRPANSTYLFGFRKHEQGQNAKEMAEFEPVIAAADAEIDRIKRHPERSEAKPSGVEGSRPTSSNAPAKAEAKATTKSSGATKPSGTSRDPSTAPATAGSAQDDGKVKVEPLPVPHFDLDPSLEISLWAEAPMLGKPTQMAWDSEGRLWVACTPIYPQIMPGAHPDDKVVILEDADRDGKADKSTVFADDLLIPSGVAVDLAFKPGAKGSKPQMMNAAYVGASTELLHLSDTNGDGKADERRVVLSGFGTEDTHHIIHTLRWGPDGRLYFDQSVYIHSHLETPWGMVRLNAGGVFAYDPRTERVEVFSKGLWNPWGHAWDKWGQSFLTDGAGFNGISWAFPGAVFNPSEGARKTMPSISPGNYPKFAGLEIIRSPLFPDDWQGTAVTCDFRAHRVVRFAIDDLGPENATEDMRAKAKSGYVTREMPDIARTAELAFRPIDVRLGPDGALYIADWTNPVINHGEVDFRDPRRDHVHGRIWRVAPKGSKPLKWVKLTPNDVRDGPKLTDDRWQEEQLAQMLYVTGYWKSRRFNDDWADAVDDWFPRNRLKAMRALALKPTVDSASKVLKAALNVPPDDPYYEFAAWISINDLATVWTDALAKGEWKANTEEKQKQLAWGLGAIRPELATAALARLMAAGQVPIDGSGPWLELIGRAGDSAALGRVFDSLVRGEIAGDVAVRALQALGEAGRARNVRPASELKDIAAFFHKPDAGLASAAIRAAGPWGIRGFIPLYAQQARSEEAAVRDAAIAALRETGATSGDARSEAVSVLTELCEDSQPSLLRRQAAAALASLDLQRSLATVADVLNDQTSEGDALEAWRGLLAAKDAPNILAASLPRNLPPVVAKTGLRAAREIGKKGEKLVAFLAPLNGETLTPTVAPSDWGAIAEIVKRDGDPARGEEIYRRTALACVTCHAIGGAGGKVGPELGTIGASAPLDYIIESVLAPAAKVKEGYHAINLTLKDGTAAAGVLARETDKDLIVRTATGQEQAVPKANVASRESIGSLMPASLVASLKDRERIDLYAFLAQLGKAGVYDASKANVARAWWLYSKGNAEAAGVGALKDSDGIPAYTNVDGRLPKEKLTELAAMIQGEAVFAVSKFNAATAGKTKLNLQGVREAWLDGRALPVASEPSPQVDLTAGDHVLAVKLETAQLPEGLRAASDGVRFVNE
jgi:putative heme-binding domain-containing protein